MIVIENVRIVSMADDSPAAIDGLIAVDGNRLAYVGACDGFTMPESVERVDGRGKVAMPGLVNAHTHVPMSVLRCYADDLPLHEWLNGKIFPAEDHLTEEDVYWASMLGIAEMIRSGTTCFVEMYFHLDSIARAVRETGIRAVLSRGLSDGSVPDHLAQGIAFAATWRNGADGRITTMLGPHAAYTCSPDTLRRVAAAARDIGVPVHIHVSETEREVTEIRQKYRMSPVELLADAGLLNRPTLAAHCVHVDDRDIALLRQFGVGIAHCPASNLKLGSGIAPLSRFLNEGIPVGIGTDSAASNNNLDMFEEMRLASLLAKGATRETTTVPAHTALRLATSGSAFVAGLGSQIGVLQAGMKADLILLDFNRPHLTPDLDLPALLVYSARGDDVSDTMVDGRWLMRERTLTSIDEAEVIRRCNGLIRRIIQEL